MDERSVYAREDAVGLAELCARAPTTLAVSRERTHGHHHGRVTDRLDALERAPSMHYYLRGPYALIDDVTDGLEHHDVDPGRIHREVFFHA